MVSESKSVAVFADRRRDCRCSGVCLLSWAPGVFDHVGPFSGAWIGSLGRPGTYSARLSPGPLWFFFIPGFSLLLGFGADGSFAAPRYIFRICPLGLRRAR